MLKSINPTTGKTIRKYESHSDKGVEQIINSVDKTWYHWQTTSFSYRSELMQNLASLLRSKKEELALLMAMEMGKVKKEGIAEIEKCAWVCDYYAQMPRCFWQTKIFRPRQPGRLLPTVPWEQF